MNGTSRLEAVAELCKTALRLCSPEGLPEPVAEKRIAKFERQLQRWIKRYSRHEDCSGKANRASSSQPPVAGPVANADHSVARQANDTNGAPAKKIKVGAELIVNSPKEKRRCYDVLGVLRTADLAEIKRVFRKRALHAHPDKPGGNHQLFLSLNEAFETLYDAKLRADYDAQLRYFNAQDGLSSEFRTEETDEEQAAETAEPTGAPDMLCETFLSVDADHWEQLLQSLSAQNLAVMIEYLEEHKVPPKRAKFEEKEAAGSGRPKSTPGLKKQGKNGYFGKLSIDNALVMTWTTTLEEAIDGSIALRKLRSRVQELVGESKPFDEAFKLATQEVRRSEQSCAFYMRFSFEMAKSGRQHRYTTPLTSEVEVMLAHRGKLCHLFDSGQKHLLESTHKDQIQQERMRAKQLQTQRTENAAKLLDALKAQREALPSLPVKPTRPKPDFAQFALYRICGLNKVGILSECDIKADVQQYFDPGAVFGVVKIARSHGRNFLKLADGTGFVPECSRKDSSRRIVEEIGGTPASLAIEDVPAADTETAKGAAKAKQKAKAKGKSSSQKPKAKSRKRKQSSSSSSSSSSSDSDS